MQEIIEIRWHARAGQGAVTAAKLLAECVILEGKFAQAMPEYGPERSGAPVRAYNRISKNPIRTHASVSRPNLLIFLDTTLLQEDHQWEDLEENGWILLNSPKTPESVQKEFPMLKKIVTLEADKISFECTGVVFPNLPMLGALLRLIAAVKLKTIKEKVRESMGKKIGTHQLDGYFQAMERGMMELKGKNG